ncbi:MAG: alpha/beta fold hydrolase [Candidatus Dormiibacterota bacterium]
MTARTLAPFDPDVVRPWHLGNGQRGALLIHGFASTPPELRRLGETLAANGFRCYAPALPGHGTTPEDLERTRWQDWAAYVAAAFDELAAECGDVVVAGQSMGGALALHLAAHDLRVRAVATLAAPIWLSGPLPALLPLIKRVVRWHRTGDDVDLWHPDAVEELYSYGIRPTRSIDELRRLCAAVRKELAEIRAPVLVVHGERDRSIDPRCAREIARRLVGSEEVRLRLLPRSGHAISVDVDRDSINAEILQWFERFARLAQAPATAGR